MKGERVKFEQLEARDAMSEISNPCKMHSAVIPHYTLEPLNVRGVHSIYCRYKSNSPSPQRNQLNSPAMRVVHL